VIAHLADARASDGAADSTPSLRLAAAAIYKLSARRDRPFRRFARNEKWSAHAPAAARLRATEAGH
jgi:hypothetical protein